MGTVNAPSGSLPVYTHEAGDPSQPAVVFLHGGGLSSKSWYPVSERLPDFYCLAPDLPGHGQSKDIPLTLDASAQAVVEVVLRPLRYASAQGALMPGAEHAWPLQAPDVFAAMVRAWATGKPLPAVLKRLKSAGATPNEKTV